MNLNHSPRSFLLGAAILAGGAMVITGCQSKDHPDEKGAVTNSLNGNNLGSVDVSQDRDKGVMTLKGDVASAEAKQQAEGLAKQAAPDRTIANEVSVQPVGDESQAKSVQSNLDDGIENNERRWHCCSRATRCADAAFRLGELVVTRMLRVRLGVGSAAAPNRRPAGLARRRLHGYFVKPKESTGVGDARAAPQLPQHVDALG